MSNRITLIYLMLVSVIGCTSPKVDNEVSNQVNPDAPEETMQWGQLVGTWNCISYDLATDASGNDTWHENKATWKWEFVLDGHGIQDFWYQEDNNPNAAQKSFHGTNIRIFNPRSKLWEVVWMETRTKNISTKYSAKYEDGDVIMYDASNTWKVTFFNIQKDTFDWKYEVPQEDDTWKVISKIEAVRQ